MTCESGGAEPGELLASLRFPARPAELKRVRTLVEEAVGACGCDPDTVRDIVLAVDEACQNVIRHAYAEVEDGEAVLECRRVDDNIVILLRDFANAVDPATIKPRALDDLRPGGLGVHFINEVMDSVTYLPRPTGHGNLLRMKKKVG